MISQRLRQLRREKNLTLDQLAALSGINRGTIHRIESSEGSPRIDTLEGLCHALGVELHDFFRPTGVPTPEGELDATNGEGPSASSGVPAPIDQDQPANALGIRRGLLDWFEHLEALIHESTDMLAVMDKDGFIIYESPSTMNMLGCSRGECCTRPWCHWVHPDDQELLRTNISTILNHPKAHITLEYRLRYRDDSWHWARSTFSNQLKHPAIQGILANTHDITRLKELELNLKASNGRLGAIVEAIPDMYLLVRQDGVVLDFQDKGMDNALMHQPSVVGLHGCDLPLPQVNLEWMCELVRKACDTNQLQTAIYEIEIDGKRHIREARIQRSGPDEALALIRDITDLKHNEERLVQAQKFEALSIVASGISRHFNNLLMNIQSDLELSIQLLSMEPPIRQFLENIQRSLTRAVYITTQLRDFAGHPTLCLELVDFNKVIQESVSLWLQTYTTQHRVELQLSDNLPMVFLDRNQIRRVLLNLLSNAAESMGAELGSIRIRTGKTHLDEATIASDLGEHDIAGSGDFLMIEIQDTGCGMDPNTLTRIFDPFFTTKPNGRGLGLSATEGIARAHRGGIQVLSSVGRGSIFRFYFPSTTTESSQDSANEVPVPIECSISPLRGKILVVEDEEIIRLSLSGLLTTLGYEVIEAVDGQDGVELFREHAKEISIVIMDLNMPRMNGNEACRFIRVIHPNVKVILSTGYSEQEAVEVFKDLPISTFLRKPYDLTDLQAALSRCEETEP